MSQYYKNILVTGASGFIGKGLCKFLESNFEVSKLSIRNGSNLEILIHQDIDVIIHLSGKAHDLNDKNNLKDYIESNFELTKKIYDAYLKSNAKLFIYFSSIKAVCDNSDYPIDENAFLNPISSYGISKKMAEDFILNSKQFKNKRNIILRPSLIYGPNLKGNLKLLAKFIKYGFPWPFNKFQNKKSFLFSENLYFIVDKIISKNIDSGVYNVSDNENLSTNEIVRLIAKSLNKKIIMLNVPKSLIIFLASLGTLLKLPFNKIKLTKLTSNLVVDSSKIVRALATSLPYNTKSGLIKTFKIK